MIVESFMGHKIIMKGLNCFACLSLSLYGYSTVRVLKNAMKREIEKKAKLTFKALK